MTSPQPLRLPQSAAEWTEHGVGRLPGHLGIVVTEMEPGRMAGTLAVLPHHWAPNGFLHAATVVALADTLCGYGCNGSLPKGAIGFTTIELKSNHLGTVREGKINGVARLIHGGRTTQVWDAEVTNAANGKAIATFRCTQLILYPRE